MFQVLAGGEAAWVMGRTEQPGVWMLGCCGQAGAKRLTSVPAGSAPGAQLQAPVESRAAEAATGGGRGRKPRRRRSARCRALTPVARIRRPASARLAVAVEIMLVALANTRRRGSVSLAGCRSPGPSADARRPLRMRFWLARNANLRSRRPPRHEGSEVGWTPVGFPWVPGSVRLLCSRVEGGGEQRHRDGESRLRGLSAGA